MLVSASDASLANILFVDWQSGWLPKRIGGWPNWWTDEWPLCELRVQRRPNCNCLHVSISTQHITPLMMEINCCHNRAFWPVNGS